MNKLTKVKVEDDEVSVQWDAKLGRMPQGYPWGADFHKDRIRIAAHTRKAAAREHMLHELLHKIWEKSGLTDSYARTTEEFIITCLTGWLVDILRDNPELVEFITEEA